MAEEKKQSSLAFARERIEELRTSNEVLTMRCDELERKQRALEETLRESGSTINNLLVERGVLKKELEQSKSMNKYYQDQGSSANAEMQGVHSILDALGVPSEGSKNERMPLIARIFAWREGLQAKEKE
jgi:hypothetical protein